jgi:hypothetical protein
MSVNKYVFYCTAHPAAGIPPHHRIGINSIQHPYSQIRNQFLFIHHQKAPRPLAWLLLDGFAVGCGRLKIAGMAERPLHPLCLFESA